MSGLALAQVQRKTKAQNAQLEQVAVEAVVVVVLAQPRHGLRCVDPSQKRGWAWVQSWEWRAVVVVGPRYRHQTTAQRACEQQVEVVAAA